MATLRSAMMTALACGMVVSVMSSGARAAENEFTVGGQWFDQTVPEAKYQEFREVPRGAFVQSFLVRQSSGRNSLTLWGANAIRSDQATKLTWANGARWRMDLGYAQIPHTFSQVARWAWFQSSPGVFVLPDSLQANNQAVPSSYTQRMSDFLKAAAGVDLRFATKNSTARLRGRPARGWLVEVKATERERQGLKPYAMTFGFSTAIENPEPIDQRVVDADATADYHKNRVSLRASVGLSAFDNHVKELRIDNPKRITDVSGGDGPKVGVLDLYPNDRTVRGSVALAYALPRYTAITATLGLAQTTQDDRFLGFTNNSALPQSSRDSLPAQSLEGKARQINGSVSLTTRPVAHLDGTAHFRYADYDNRTPERNFIGQTPYEVTWQRFIELENPARDNKQWQTGLEANYAFTPRIRIGGIAEYHVRDRNHREVEKDKETLFGGRLKLQPLDGLTLSGLYTRGDRKVDEFLYEDYFGLKTGATPNLFDTPGLIEQPGLRRFDVADRVQDHATGDVSYAFGERLDLSASYSYLRNDFSRDTTLGLGLQKERTHALASSATLHATDQLDLIGSYGFGKAQTFQRSRTSNSSSVSPDPINNWTAKIDEEEVYVSAGFAWAPLKRLSVGADYEFSRNVTDYDLADGLNLAQDLPSTVFRRHETLLDASWKWLDNTSVIGRWGWEEYDVTDFASNNVPLIFPVTGTANAIFLGDSSQSYRAHRLALLVKHTF